MACPLCGIRKQRRACPALGQAICPVCCGTKRIVAIPCPDDCAYLASAREHPAAVVKRQQERDVSILFPTIQTLTERQYQLFFLLQSVIARHEPEGFTRLLDDDVAEAAGALASTLETASRGIIYEHAAHSPPAQQLMAAIKAFLAEIRERGTMVYDGEMCLVLRAIERGARETRSVAPGDDAYLALMARLIHERRESPQRTAEQSLIVP